MKHVFVLVKQEKKFDQTFRVSATNNNEWKTLARVDGPLKNYREEALASAAANEVDFSTLPVNKLSDELPWVTVHL